MADQQPELAADRRAANQPLTYSRLQTRFGLGSGNLSLLFSSAILGLFILAGAVGPIVAPHDPNLVDLAHGLLPPGGGGNWSYALGTDELGRDVLSRLLGGARISLIVAVAAIVLSGGFGLTVAMLSGYVGGHLDSVLMRLTDAALAFPFILLAIVLAGIFGASLRNVIIIIALGGWASYARVIRSQVLSLKTQEFVTMAEVMGAGPLWIIRRHLVPNVASSILVLATLQLGQAILTEGSLSFLGLGVPPPAPSWGGMLADSRNYLLFAWWLPVLPGLALSLTVLASNLMGDWLRTSNDPAKLT
jgi:peptide/nickel transport system permease protein